MKLCCACNAAIKNVKMAREKKQTFSPMFFSIRRNFPKRYRFLVKQCHIFSYFKGCSRHFYYIFTCLGLIVKL